jgi:fermentation-respiration switch protein FrsA (DUF1100 family)
MGINGMKFITTKRAFLFIALLLLIFLVIGVGGRMIEPRVVFRPEKFPSGDWSLVNWDLPHGSRIEDVFFTSKDGTHLHGWYFSAATDTGPVILYMHGNAGNVTHRRQWFQTMVGRGVSVFSFDYRGFGKSDGDPSEEGVYADATGAYEYLLKQRKISPERIFLFGHSLGGAIAVDLASRKPSGGLIVEASFTTAPAVAGNFLPVYPFQWFLRSKFESIAKIPNVHSPVLIMHGDRDYQIPIKFGRELYAAANQPKQFYQVNGGSHDNLDLVGGTTYYDTLMTFISKQNVASPSP